MLHKNRLKLGILVSTVAALAMAAQAFAAVSITAPVNTNIGSDTAVSGSVALPAITFTEGAAGDIPVGALGIGLPAGFLFDTGSAADVTATGTGLTAIGTVSFPDSTHARINVTGTSTTAGMLKVGAAIPLKVKALSGAPLAATGNITLTEGALSGITASTSFGTLTQVPGAANKLVFTTQPPATVNTGTPFSAGVSVEDQFGNILTGDSGRSVNLSVVPVSPTSTTGTLSGASVINDASGVANFTGLSFSATGTIELIASSSALSSALSGGIVLSAPTTTTTPPTTTPPAVCPFANGSLVQLQGFPTVYMVVNCVLRPFNSEAIFHAHGKKFKDVEDINEDEGRFAIGRPIGQGNDDDSTVVVPPSGSTTPPTLTSTSTLPNISGLPDGAIVKLPGSPTVYLVSNGQLQPFTSATIFNMHHKKFTDVQTITVAQFNQLSLGNAVTPPDGTLLKGTNNTVFVVQNGQLIGIPSMNVLNKHGWSLKNLTQLSDGEMGSLPHGGTEN